LAYPGTPRIPFASDTATDEPKESKATVSEPSSSASWLHLASLLANTYALPACVEWFGSVATGAPTTAVVPEITTDQPN
jgi:hypothetical protein